MTHPSGPFGQTELAAYRVGSLEGTMCGHLWRLLRDEEAATAVEYAVMLALIIGAVITAIGSVGSQTGGMWSNIQASVNAVGFGS